MVRKSVCVLILLVLQACSPSSLEDFHYEGGSVCNELTQELKGIENYEQLIKEAPKIKAYFDKLVTLIIQARKYQKEHEEVGNLIEAKSLAGASLLCELKRIYEIERGRDVIEKAQQEALIKLSYESSVWK